MSNETKHTPGPWSYDGHGINCAAELYDMNAGIGFKGERIAKTCLNYDFNSPDRDRAIADSNLIAAAPELLEALRECVTDDGAHCFNSNKAENMRARLNAISSVARAAIAKAEGR